MRQSSLVESRTPEGSKVMVTDTLNKAAAVISFVNVLYEKGDIKLDDAASYGLFLILQDVECAIRAASEQSERDAQLCPTM